jgi:hypothetical protein
MVVFVVGVLFKTEKFTLPMAANMVVVVTGILIASYGADHRSRHLNCQMYKAVPKPQPLLVFTADFSPTKPVYGQSCRHMPSRRSGGFGSHREPH